MKTYLRSLLVLFRQHPTALGFASKAVLNGVKRAVNNNSGRIGLAIVLTYVVVALIGPWLAPYRATEFNLEHQLEPPSVEFWFGTDQFGRDVFSRVLSGAGSIMVIAAAGTTLGVTLGAVVGMTSGYRGGIIDDVVMRVMDGFMSFPALLLALVVLTTAPQPESWLPSWLAWDGLNIVLTIVVVFTPYVARVTRSVTLALKNLEFVESARLGGDRTYYILFREILPNTASVLIVEGSVRFSYAILLASSLGFLGLGVQPPSPDWGLMVSDSRKFLALAPWMALAPAGAISLLVVGMNLLTDGIRKATLHNSDLWGRQGSK